jgi:hypothetical protein
MAIQLRQWEQLVESFLGREDAPPPLSQDGCVTLGPGDEAEFVRLHHAGVS